MFNKIINFKNNINYKSLFLKTMVITGVLAVITACFIIVFKDKITYSALEGFFYDFTGLKIEFINPKTVIYANADINFRADNLNIYNKDKTVNFLHSDKPEISIKPLGFIFKKANIKKLNAKKIVINIKRDEKGQIDFLNSLSLKEIPLFKNKKITLTKLISNIDNIELIFDDEYYSTKTILNLNNTDIKLSKRNKIVEINQKGTIETITNSNSQKSDISINLKSYYPAVSSDFGNLKTDISIKNFNLAVSKDFFRKYISKDIEGVSGTADLSIKTKEKNSDEQNLYIAIKNPSFKLKNQKTIILYQNMNIDGIFNLVDNIFEIKNLSIKANELSALLSGYIKKPFSKNPDINITAETKDTQINHLFYFLPDNLIFYRPKGIPTLKNSNFHGIANGKINLKLFPLNIEGNLKVSNIHIPNYPKPFRQNDVSATFIKDKVKIYTRVYTPQNEYVTIEGISNLDDSMWGKYSVNSTSKIDLSFARMYLVPIQQIIGFNIGPVPLMKISGFGNIDIKTQGTIKDAQIFGEFNATNATAEISGLDGKLTNGNCKLIFDDRNLIFKKIEGKLDGAYFNLSGTGNTKGEVNLDVNIKNSRIYNILKLFNNSVMTKKYTKFTENISASSGMADVKLNLKGKIDNYENEDFLAKLTPSGVFDFKNNKLILNNKLSFNSIKGILEFGHKQYGNIEFKINNSKINAEFSSKDSLDKITSGNNFELNSLISSDKLEFQDIIKEISKLEKYKIAKNLSNVNFYTKLNIKSQGSISLFNPDFSGLKSKGYILGLNSEKIKDIKFKSGIIKLDGDKLIFNDFGLKPIDGNITIKGTVSKFLNKRPNPDVTVFFDNVPLKFIEKLNTKIKTDKGTIKNGKIEFKSDNINLNSISIDYQSMPLFLNAHLKDIYKTKYLDANFSTIANEATSDKLINPYLTYPVKISGEIPFKGSFKGKPDNYSIDFTATLPKNSDIYFSGANIGDTNLKREITGKVDVNQNGSANINNLRIIKYISNQNGKTNPLTTFRINGQLIQNLGELNYNNLKISTSSPVNVRILNLIFKKSLLKKGNFECNVNLKGNVKTPKVTGKFNLQDLDIPLYDTIIDNIKINITENFVDGEINAKSNSNDIKGTIRAINNPKPPYIIENIDIVSNKMDILELFDSLTPTQNKNDVIQKQEAIIRPEDIIVKNGNFDFKNINLDKIKAQNLKGNFKFENNIFEVKNIILDMAEGKIEAEGRYGIKSKKYKLSAKMEECNSNTLAKEFLQTPDQIFGKINGSVELEGKDLSSFNGIKNVTSNVDFNINNGKMPKLGSLEYLLRAGNLFKNGILGLSLNNIIEVLTPYKTGEFEKISGRLSINNGEIKNLEILSKGKNLSLYLAGTYDILQNFADIKIYGRLSKKVSSALGKVGNASISQFINTVTNKSDSAKLEQYKEQIEKIPSIEGENTQAEYFRVKVLGDINKDNYIKNFLWL